jgi:glycosyltransferase involved in cell wall biosynthesis
MAAGSVVVGTDGASFEQLIEHGRSGFLAERGNAESLTAAAEAALALSGPQRSAVQVAAQERMQELSPEKQIPKLVSLYHRAIEAGRGG